MQAFAVICAFAMLVAGASAIRYANDYIFDQPRPMPGGYPMPNPASGYAQMAQQMEEPAMARQQYYEQNLDRQKRGYRPNCQIYPELCVQY